MFNFSWFVKFKIIGMFKVKVCLIKQVSVILSWRGWIELQGCLHLSEAMCLGRPPYLHFLPDFGPSLSLFEFVQCFIPDFGG